MQQKWWLVAAGLVGIGLAVLLFPKPDTGGDIPDPTPGRVDFNAAPEEEAGGAIVENRGVDAEKVARPVSGRMRPMDRGQGLTPPIVNANPADPDQLRRGPSPAALENVRLRSQPDAVFAGRAAAPISLIRRQLLLSDSEEAKDLGNEMAGLVSALREQRRDPRMHDFDVLLQQVAGYGDQVRTSDHMSDPQVAQSIERLDEVLAEYAAVKSEQPEE